MTQSAVLSLNRGPQQARMHSQGSAYLPESMKPCPVLLNKLISILHVWYLDRSSQKGASHEMAKVIEYCLLSFTEYNSYLTGIAPSTTPTSLALKIAPLNHNTFYAILKYCVFLWQAYLCFFYIFQRGVQYPVEMTTRIQEVHIMNITEEASKPRFDIKPWNHNLAKAQNVTNFALDFK